MTQDTVLQSVLTTIANLGYLVKSATEPTIREYDGPTPATRVSPYGRDKIEWMAFQHVSVTRVFQVVYIESNNLNPVVPSTFNKFKSDLIDNFMGVNANQLLVLDKPIWYSVVEDMWDFDRSKLPQGYNFSPLLVKVSFMEN